MIPGKTLSQLRAEQAPIMRAARVEARMWEQYEREKTMLRIKPYVPVEHPEEPPQPMAEVNGIDLPWCDGVKEKWWKRMLVKGLKKNIQVSWHWIKRLNAPVKAKDLPEIEEEDSP